MLHRSTLIMILMLLLSCDYSDQPAAMGLFTGAWLLAIIGVIWSVIYVIYDIFKGNGSK